VYTLKDIPLLFQETTSEKYFSFGIVEHSMDLARNVDVVLLPVPCFVEPIKFWITMVVGKFVGKALYDAKLNSVCLSFGREIESCSCNEAYVVT
jgi:hypothetical protein